MPPKNLRLLLSIFAALALTVFLLLVPASLTSAFGDPVSPRNQAIPASSIAVSASDVVVPVAHARLVRFTGTDSMLPVLDAKSTGILSPVPDVGTLAAGDIIVYRYGDRNIVHRIIETGSDSSGWFAVTKGDNLPSPDPAKVRASQVIGRIVGIIY